MVGRTDVSSDPAIISMIFYSLMFDTKKFPTHNNALNSYYNKLLSNLKRPIIIDAGANIGAASIYFNEIYPSSKIYSIEPGLDNYNLLVENMRGRDFHGIQGALAAEDGIAYLNTQDHGPIGYRTDEQGDTPVQAYGLKKLISNLPEDERMLVLKIDVEGAEKEIFKNESEFLAKVPLIIMEPHDWMLPFEGSSRNFYFEICKLDFDILMHGENIFCFNNEILKELSR
jgi:FkbM family methyltransferase